MPFLLLFFFLLFAYLVWRRLLYGLILIAALLPSYLIRFQLFGLPMTVLEGMILIIVAVWVIKHWRDWKQIFNIKYLIFNIQYLQWLAAIVLFLAAATIAVFVSPNTRAALGLWKAYFLEPILLFVVFISTIKTREDLNRIIWGLVLGALPVALFAVIQKFTGWLIPNPFWQAEETRRATSFFGYPNAVALYLAPILPLTFYLLIEILPSKQKILKILRILDIKYLISLIFLISNVSLSILAIFFAHSTGAIVALAATLFIFCLLNKKTRWWAIGLLAATTILIPLTPLKDPFAKEVLLGGQSGIVRVNMWAETVEMLKDHPILGAGLSGYQETVRPYHILNWAEIYLYPHNLFLNFWSEIGLLGLISFLWLILNFFKLGFKKIFGNWKLEIGNSKSPNFNKSLAMSLIASMIIIAIHGLADVPYFKNDLAVMFWLLIGLMLINAKKSRTKFAF